MKGYSLLTGILIILLLSGCGSISKMRYSRGFKSNLEFNFGKKESKSEQKTAAKAIKRQKTAPSVAVINETSTTGNNPEATYLTPSIIKNKHGKSGSGQLNTRFKKGRFIPIPAVVNHTNAVNARPVDPTSAAAGLLFYGGLAMYYLSALAPYIYFLSLVGLVGIIIGFCLAIVGIGKIKRSNHEYSGMALDISIIVVFGLIIIGSIILILLLFALFV